MPLKVIICRDFDHMSEIGVQLAVNDIRNRLVNHEHYVLGLATGNTPTGLYKHLAKAANAKNFDPTRIKTFNLDEYIGLPGENAQQRALHPESYSYFMVQELFGLLQVKFNETNVPWGTLIDQTKLIAELEQNPDDWEEQGTDKGKAVVIKKNARSEYLQWIRRDILNAYQYKIECSGGIDLHVVGVGGRGHVAFHESGIPFEGNKMLLVKLDDNTVENAISDGHFDSNNHSPRYAVSMGAELVFQAKTVLLLANGNRKAEPVAESLLLDTTPEVPISYGQILARKGGNMIYVIDQDAAGHILDNSAKLKERGIEIEDFRNQAVSQRVEELLFFRNPDTGLMG
ncbi:MAG: 6-phosphogluconolactonase [Deltaproteobacteria bacterium]|nr:6-phosphogluconolactonase [Deltaproteobacteria bacterium]